MKYFFIIFIFCTTPLFSQNTNEHFKGKDFAVGQKYLIYQNDTYLYRKASYDSKILNRLGAGEEIEVIELTNIPSGRGTNVGVYLKVKTAYNKIGFISSTDLALGFFVAKCGIIVMYQKQRHVEETLLHFNRLKKNEDVMDLGAFSFESPDFVINLYGDRDLNRIDHVISMTYRFNKCESLTSTMYLSLAFETNELLFFAKLKNYCPDIKTSTYQTIIFPDEEDGVNDGVVYYSEKKVLVEEKHKAYKTYIYTKVYKWASGVLLEPIDEYYW